MASQAARTHSHLSNRASARAALERKTVFKSVLENPFQIDWPSVPVNVQNVFLARLMASLENIPSRAHASRKRKEGTHGNMITIEEHSAAQAEHGNVSSTLPQTLDKRPVGSGASQYLVVGINEVTKALESQLRLSRKHAYLDTSQSGDLTDSLPTMPQISLVFVCCADVDPPVLVDHIRYLVAGCNSIKNARHTIKLVPLPKDSESAISQSLGVRRAAVIGFRNGSPLCEMTQDILDSVPVVSAPWLCPPDSLHASRLVPTHIKQVRTTAPKDMKAAREQRSKAREAAKRTGSSRAVRRKPRVTLTTGSVGASSTANLTGKIPP